MSPEAVAALASLYLARGLWVAHREVAECRADNLRAGAPAPLWPVWLVVTLGWPMLAAQGLVLWALAQLDIMAAIRADRREAGE